MQSNLFISEHPWAIIVLFAALFLIIYPIVKWLYGRSYPPGKPRRSLDIYGEAYDDDVDLGPNGHHCMCPKHPKEGLHEFVRLTDTEVVCKYCGGTMLSSDLGSTSDKDEAND